MQNIEFILGAVVLSVMVLSYFLGFMRGKSVTESENDSGVYISGLLLSLLPLFIQGMSLGSIQETPSTTEAQDSTKDQTSEVPKKSKPCLKRSDESPSENHIEKGV